MASPGESLRDTWTASYKNRLDALLTAFGRMTGSGNVQVSPGKNGLNIVVPPSRNAVSTLQGILAGGDPPAVDDGTVILDLYAFNAYSLQAGIFVLSAGTATVTVFVDSSPVSWLTNIAVSTSLANISIPNPVTDLTHIVAVGSQLSVQISSASIDAAGLSFSFNVPF